jgi:hypothetical protein
MVRSASESEVEFVPVDAEHRERLDRSSKLTDADRENERLNKTDVIRGETYTLMTTGQRTKFHNRIHRAVLARGHTDDTGPGNISTKKFILGTDGEYLTMRAVGKLLKRGGYDLDLRGTPQLYLNGGRVSPPRRRRVPRRRARRLPVNIRDPDSA